MNYSTRLALGVKDYHLELDEQHFARPIEGQSDRIVIHLIRSYPIRCVNTVIGLSFISFGLIQYDVSIQGRKFSLSM